jgi:polar amino acid transport system substrate-binding protein
MAGLVPAIHRFGGFKSVDARAQPGHDGGSLAFAARVPGRMVYKALRSQGNPAHPLLMARHQAKSPKIARHCLALLAALCLVSGAHAQTPAKSAPSAPQATPQATPQAAPQAVPGFWDPRRRPERPDLSRLTVIRFLTETDYPPFNYTGADGNPAGFNVDLARSLCEEIKVTCTVQMRRFETLVDALTSNRGDAIIASMAASPQLRARVDFTDPYYRVPARFVSRKDAVMSEVRPEYLEGKKVGVIAGSAHEAYLKAMFTDAELHAYPNDEALRIALRKGEVDLIFGDAISLAFWINGTDSGDCCAFSGGPFAESRFFGEGIGIAVRKGNDVLRQALNWALFRVWEKGRYTDLWLRYFSVSPF